MPQSPLPSPPPEIAAIFAKAAAERAFPGGVVWLGRGAEIAAHAAFGTDAYEDPSSQTVTTETLYDIASLTKLFTASALLIAAREVAVSLETPLGDFLPRFAAPEFESITLRRLLNHSHGLALHIQSLVAQPLATWVDSIAAGGFSYPPGEGVTYTCTAFYLLGLVIEKMSGRPLAENIESRIIVPLGLQRTLFGPLRRFDRLEIAPTARDPETGAAERGVVHDEAARAVEAAGETCGNAGLFSTAADLARFAQMWLQGGMFEGRQIIDPRDVRAALTETIAGQGYNQGLGWHEDVASWMSAKAPHGSAGHPGFTGPTMFITPDTSHICIILDNRVYPTRDGPIRMVYHRRIAEWLFAAMPVETA